MRTPTHTTDHSRRAILSLPIKFWGKPNIASFVWALCEEVQQFEDAVWSVINKRLLDNASHPQLLIIGKLVGQPDLGYETEVYRTMIRGRIKANVSKANIDSLLSALRVFYTGPIRWRRWAPKVLEINAEGAVHDARAADEFQIMRAAKGAGVNLTLTTAPTVGALRWDNNGDTEAATGGWGSSTSSAFGGALWSAQKV